MLVSLVLAACGGVVGTDDGLPDGEDPLCAGNTWFPDRDADGYGDPERRVQRCERPDGAWVDAGGDCDDADAARHPFALELADAVDQDCDGAVDEGTPWGDADGDGWCADAVRCGPAGVRPGDCADDDADRFPGALERCNGLDDDCDEALPPGEADADEDGALACGDCDDADGARFPGAAERCDGVDQDCDGWLDVHDADGDGWAGCPAPGGALDLLVIVDRGPESTALRSAVAPAARALVEGMQARGADWRVAVVGADGPALLGQVGRADAEPGDALEALVDLPPVTGTLARPLEVASELAAAPGWRRRGAALAVWVVSAREDRSAADLAGLASALGGSAGEDAARLSVVSGGTDGCDDAGVVARVAHRLVEAARRTGGVAVSACATSWPAFAAAAWIPEAPEADCDDAAADVFPGAPEVCDGADDDCDGRVDEDDDGDGVDACAGDCDDADRHRFPRAPERCNGVDDDCDGQVPAAERDADGDGVSTCAGDCDDARAEVHPGAVEVCGDGLDADCSGDDGSGVDLLDGDADGASPCDGDCDDADDAVFPGSVEHPFDGVDDDCDGLVDGLDPDEALRLDLPSAGTITHRAGRTLFHLCGTPYAALTVGGDGYVLPGTTSVVDASPTTEELRARAPFLAVGWEDLSGRAWSGGRFLSDVAGGASGWLVVRPQGVAVVFDHVPYRDGGHLTSVTNLGLDDHVDVRVLEGNTTDETLVGLACGTRAWSRVDFGDTPVACIAPGPDDAASGALASGEVPVRLTTTCTP